MYYTKNLLGDSWSCHIEEGNRSGQSETWPGPLQISNIENSVTIVNG